MIGFLSSIFGRERPVDPVPPEEVERRIREHNEKIRELGEAIHVLKDHEPDERTYHDAP